MHDMPHWHRFRNNLRLIDSGAGEGGSGDPATGDPANTGEDIDWKAKFEEQRAHSRKWEQRAKDNSKAAEELQQFKDSQLSEPREGRQTHQELRSRQRRLEAGETTKRVEAQVARTGVPASLLHWRQLRGHDRELRGGHRPVTRAPSPGQCPTRARPPTAGAGADERAWSRAALQPQTQSSPEGNNIMAVDTSKLHLPETHRHGTAVNKVREDIGHRGPVPETARRSSPTRNT
ncbi:MAG: heavy metal transporter [Bifidobacterium longum]